MAAYIVRLFPEPGEVEQVIVNAPSSVAAALRAVQSRYPGDGPERFALHVVPDYRSCESLRRINAQEGMGEPRRSVQP